MAGLSLGSCIIILVPEKPFENKALGHVKQISSPWARGHHLAGLQEKISWLVQCCPSRQSVYTTHLWIGPWTCRYVSPTVFPESPAADKINSV